MLLYSPNKMSAYMTSSIGVHKVAEEMLIQDFFINSNNHNIRAIRLWQRFRNNTRNTGLPCAHNYNVSGS